MMRAGPKMNMGAKVKGRKKEKSLTTHHTLFFIFSLFLACPPFVPLQIDEKVELKEDQLESVQKLLKVK